MNGFNELILLGSVLLIFSTTVLLFGILGERGLYAWTVIATIMANIEVLILVRAFGMEQTLGNVLFASTFLCTDIASEIYGKKKADQIVNVGILAGCSFMLISQLWLLYIPSENDIMFEHIKAVFANTPRLIIVSLLVYGICQKFDVWLYDRWWSFTKKHFKDERRFLWLRNNGSTLISQLLNAVLFTLGAFYGVYDTPTLISVLYSSYAIFLVLALVDTFFIYIARRWHEKKQDAQGVQAGE